MQAAKSLDTHKPDEALIPSRPICENQRICFSLLPLLPVTQAILSLDITLSLLYSVEVVFLLSMRGMVLSAYSQLAFGVISDFVSIALLPFAVLGLAAIFLRSRRLFSLYLYFKWAETVFMLVYWPAISHIYCPLKGWDCVLTTFLITCIHKVLLNAYCLYCVFRTYQTWRLPLTLSIRNLKSEELSEDR